MKPTLLVLFILCAATAFGQASVLSNQPQIFTIPDHSQHADHSSLACEHSLVGGGEGTYTYAHGELPLWEFSLACEHPLVGGGEGTYTYAHGELPLWEFGSPNPAPAALGDVARAYRKEKMAARKAETVLEKQGS